MRQRLIRIWTRSPLYRLLLTVAIGLCLAAPAAARNNVDTPNQPSGTIAVGASSATDAPIQDRIESILAGVPDFDLVSVAVQSGIVTLSGEVTDPASLDRLDRLIARVDGVVAIENEVALTTDFGTRLGSVRDRFVSRVNQIVAGLPFVAFGLAVGAVIVWIGGWLSRRKQTLQSVAPNPFIAEFLGQGIRLASWVVALVVALDLMEATALLGTLLGAAGILGLSLSFAMRDTIENFVASVFLSIRQPFRHNDLIEVQNQCGRVVRMTARGTTLLTLDGIHIRIPNSMIYKAVVTNFTRNAERRFVVDLVIDPAADLNRAREMALTAAAELDFVLEKPDPVAWFEARSELQIVLRVAAWVSQDGTDFELARGEAFRVLRETLDTGGFAVAEPIHRIKIDPSDANDGAAPHHPEPHTSPLHKSPAPNLRPDKAFEDMVARNQSNDQRDLLRRVSPARPKS